MDLGSRPMPTATPQAEQTVGGQQQSPQEQYFGKMKFHVTNGDQEGFADEHQLVNDLRTAGYQPLGVSADGLKVTIQGDQGPQEVPTNEILQKMGWQVKGYQPQDVDHSHVSPELRLIIESPGLRDDDHAKEAVIKSRLQRGGIKDPQVVGAGSDWFVFNPSTSQYIALTNKPGMDLSDLGEVGSRALGTVGSAAGAVFGTGAGPAGTIGGAMAGGFAGNRLTDAGAAALEPSYLDAVKHRGLGENLKTLGSELGTDALAGVGGVGLSKLGGVLGRGLMRSGLGSSAARALGGSAELGGKAIQGTADFLGQGTPREFGIAMADPTNISLYGELAQLPRSALRGGARAMGGVGESDFMKGFAPDQAAKLRDISAKLLTRRGAADPTLGARMAEKMGAASGAPESDIGAEEIMQNWGDMAAQKIGRARASNFAETNPEIGEEARQMGLEHFNESRFNGMPVDKAQRGADEVRAAHMRDWHESMANDSKPNLSGFGSLGRGIDNAAKVGDMGVKGIGIPYDAAMGTARMGGRALRYGGRALRSAGEGLAPLETPMTLKGGSEELFNRLKRRQSALQRQGYTGNIMPDTLAQN